MDQNDYTVTVTLTDDEMEVLRDALYYYKSVFDAGSSIRFRVANLVEKLETVGEDSCNE
jgi:hypothetical protein